MKDNLYHEFYDPTEDFLHETRAFCYELAAELICFAKQKNYDNWYEDTNTIRGILLLLFTWNFAALQTKKLTFRNVGELLCKTKNQLKLLEKYSIQTADNDVWYIIEQLFNQFSTLFGQTGASKALSLLNSELFVMWDTAIRKRLNKDLIPGINNGESGSLYIIFLKGIQRLIKEYRIQEKLPPGTIIAKKIDEYNYVRIVMNKKVQIPDKKDDIEAIAMKNILPDNLRGRSINDYVIPTVCNLKNMLIKLKEINGNVMLLKPWEKRSYNAYLIDKIKSQILNSKPEDWKGIIRNHILREEPKELGASCIDIYLVAYVSSTYGQGKQRFFQYIKEKGISPMVNTAQAIWQVGKGDGVFLDILNQDGSIKDMKFMLQWEKG